MYRYTHHKSLCLKNKNKTDAYQGKQIGINTIAYY